MRDNYIKLLFFIFLWQPFCTAKAGVLPNAPILIAGKSSKLNIITHNVCYDACQLIVNEGNDSLGIMPTLGVGRTPADLNLNYTVIDTLSMLNKIVDLDIQEGTWNFAFTKYFFVVGDNVLLSYSIQYGQPGLMPVILPNDTVYLDSIIDIEATSGQLLLIRGVTSQNNFLIYDIPNVRIPAFSMQLNMVPQLITSAGTSSVIIGEDTSGRVVFKCDRPGNQVCSQGYCYGAVGG